MGEKPRFHATAKPQFDIATPLQEVLVRLQLESTLQSPELYRDSIGMVFDRSNRISRSKDEMDALNRLYGNKIGKLIGQNGENKSGVAIFNTLFDHVFDPGANRKVSCVVPIGGETVHYEEEAVPIHSRASLIGTVLDEIENNRQVEIGLIDLKDLRGADSTLVGQKNNPADVLINKSALALRKALHEAWIKNGWRKKEGDVFIDDVDHSYEVGRYGGDEFIFTLVGHYSPEQKGEIVNTIQAELKKQTGYYKNSDGIWEGREIQLKKGKNKKVVEWINLPDKVRDEQKRMIFIEYFQRGLLLNPDELQRIINKYSSQGEFSEALYRNDYPKNNNIYPESITSVIDKIAFIKMRHPELALYFDLARSYDREEGGENEQSRQETLLKLIERSIFDPLLGEAIYTRFDFQEQVQKNAFSEVMIFDVKCIKEINEGMSYADADGVIVTLWKDIENCIQENERGQLYVSRVGGTFMLGLKKGSHISKESFDKLQILGSHRLDLFPQGKDAVSVPIGSSFWMPQAGISVRQILDFTDHIFYSHLFDDLIYQQYKDPSLVDKIMMIDLAMIVELPYHQLSKIEIYALFLRGKRAHERTDHIINLFNGNIDIAWADGHLYYENETFNLSDVLLNVNKKRVEQMIYDINKSTNGKAIKAAQVSKS